MPAPGGHLVSAVGHNLHAAVALVMRPLGAKDGAAAPAAAGVAVSSALWRGEAPTVSHTGGSADLSVGAVVAGAAPSGDGAAGEVSWVSATALPAVAAATAEFPPAGPRGEPGLPEEGGAAVLLRGVGLASPGLVGAGCRFGSVGVAGRAPGGASAQGGLVCTSPALAPTRGGRRVPVALVWEFQGGPSGRRCAGRRLRGRTLRVDPGRAVGFLAPLHFRGGARRRPPPPRPSPGSGGSRGTTWRCGAGPPCAAGARTRAAERRPGSREWCRRGVQKLRARSSHSVGRSSRPGARFRPGVPGGRLGVRGRRPPPSVAVHLFRAPHLRVAARIRPGRRRLTRGPRPGAAGELSPRACGWRGS